MTVFKKEPLRQLAGIACALLLSLCAGSMATAQGGAEECDPNAELSGTLQFQGQSAGMVLGARWGTGVLTLNDGRQVPFAAQGMKLLETGIRAGDIEGEVYGLQAPEDFIGQYKGVAGGLVPFQAKGDIALVNAACVVIVARHKSAGIVLSIPAGQRVAIQFRPES